MDSEGNWAPQSPNLSEDQPERPHPQHQQYRGSISHISPFVTPTDSKSPFNFPLSASSETQQQQTSYFNNYTLNSNPPPPQQHFAMKEERDYDDEDNYQPSKAKAPPRKRVKTEDADLGNGPSFAEGIEVRTKFPVARIKRIMQADEDVGKVAQVTPVAVCRSSFATLVMSGR
jgi:hypothetical protein